MKVSLAWIFDHIDYDWKKQDINEIISKFNYVTAEIEGFSKVNIDLSQIFMAHCVGAGSPDGNVGVDITELSETASLPVRKCISGECFLVYKDQNGDFLWATCKHVGLDKDGLLPAFDVSDKDARGDWRTFFESQDIIFDVDNKSLTHRPDMWGHRGFAREIAAFLRLPLAAKKQIIAEAPKGKNSPFSIEIKAEKACSRFSGLFFESIENKPSNLFIASRLIKVGVRPISGIVDLTNYVMLDWSQPVHAYDAEKIAGKKLIARMAKDKEVLELLDGSELKLSSKDLVITKEQVLVDKEKVIGLAGVMGGLHDSVSENTKSIFFESANFDPTHIRRTVLRHGVRTESSTRFEKTLDPNQITDAILRFIFLCKEVGIETKINSPIVCVGKAFKEKTIGVRHSFLEKRSGVVLEKNDIIEPLTRLGFTVSDSEEQLGDDSDILYTITIPSYRGAKDIEIKEDILEEVIRFFGFNKIALTTPTIKREPSDLGPLLLMRKIKDFLVYSAQMMEQRNYIYYDEDFLQEIGLDFDKCLKIKNPVSENNVRIVSSLMPNLFKNIKQNCANENSLRFFEYGRVCHIAEDSVIEKKRLAGVIFEKRQAVNFYENKSYLEDLFKICGIPVELGAVEWRKIDESRKEFPWVMPYQSAEIFLNDIKIGTLGKVDTAFLCKLDALPESEAFFFDIDIDKLISYSVPEIIYSQISKFPGITFDLSFMVPMTLTVSEIKDSLLDSDDLIEKVELIDFFDKEDWVDKRSVAFRLWVSHPDKTLEKSEIEDVRDNSIKSIEKLGAELR